MRMTRQSATGGGWAEIDRMLRTARITAYKLAAWTAELGKPVVASTLHKGLALYYAKAPQGEPRPRTLGACREAMLAHGYEAWTGSPFHIPTLAATLAAVDRLAPFDAPDAGETRARLFEEVYLALQRAGLSGEAAEGAADLLAENLRIQFAREQSNGSPDQQQ